MRTGNHSAMVHKVTSSRHMTPYLFIILIYSLMTACSDRANEWSEPSTQKNSGQAASIVYSCTVATQASDGVTWRYETEEIMNLMSEIKLSVYQDERRYGPYLLSKVETDTFSDGNLTAVLTQVGAKKSIKVEHRALSITAKAENGWCSERSTDQYLGEQDTWLIDQDTIEAFTLEVSDPCDNPCRFSVKSSPSVRRVVYEVDGWVVAESEDVSAEFATSYTFNTLGRRTMTAVGFNSEGDYVSSDSKVIDLTSGQDGTGNDTSDVVGGPVNVPYYYQFDNGLYPSASCQNTSIAMVLSYLGANIHPDEITREFTKDRAQSVSGFNHVFNTLARRFGVREISSFDEGSFAQLKASLDRGEPAIVHGFFTGFGHVLVVTGYDEGGYYVNDPAGTWSQTFRGGYPNAWNESTQGKGIYYRRDAFERAIATYDGYSFTSLYLHILR